MDVVRGLRSVPRQSVGVVGDQYGLVLRRSRVLLEVVSVESAQRLRRVERHVLDHQARVLRRRVHKQLQPTNTNHRRGLKVKVKEADSYSAFIEVPYTQGTQVRITQCYLQTTPYLPLPRKHSPDGASETEVADI